MATAGNFLAGLLNGFNMGRARKQEREEQEAEKKARTKLFELQIAREQRLLEQMNQQDAQLKQQQNLKGDFFNTLQSKLSGVQTRALPGTGVQLGDVAATQAAPPAMGLAEALSQPDVFLKSLQAGVPLPQPEQAPERIRELEALLQRPELASLDAALRRSSASQINNIQPGNFGLSPPPTGYARPDPTKAGLVPEPGGPVAVEQAEKAKKEANKSQSIVQKTESVSQEIDKAIKLVNPFTTGISSALTAGVKGTDAYTLAQALQTIKANIGFDRLQEMRENSPTGGALGQVAVQELNGLQNSLVSLDQGLKGEELIAGLQKVKGHYDRWKQAVEQAERELPEGLPPGSRQIGTSNGKPVYETPDGKRMILE